MIIENINFYRKQDKVNIFIYCYLHKLIYNNHNIDGYKIYLGYNVKNKYNVGEKNEYKIRGELAYKDNKKAVYIKLTLTNKDGKSIHGNKITFNNISKINRHKIINELANTDLTSVFEIGEPIEHKILYMEYLNDLLNVKNIIKCCFGI